ncbi:selenium cofactor biosynthesis protein YqeC [Clostridium sp.]|uniref:selenium cofactor biosynthesis protein YqeC n=1 Tax=Clostridium sp. TaxID=1506 RepID=UPI003D6D81A2
MKLSNYLGLVKSDIISIVGAGGKTTMMFKLGGELRGLNKVLVTTTTKIYLPLEDKYDFICTDSGMLSKYAHMQENGIYILGSGVNGENKILGLAESELDELVPYFDYILIEADGAKKKCLKGWNETEPIIFKRTTKTVGIIDIKALGMVINENNVHRSEIFCELTGAKQGETVKIEHLLKIIINPLGLFKAALGEKILYINKVESANDLILAKALVNETNIKGENPIDQILIGSLKTDTYLDKV